jgi:hypothetical protein
MFSTTALPIPYLHDSCLQGLREGELLGEVGLREFTDERHQVAHAVARVSRRGDHGDVLLRVLVLVEQSRVQTLREGIGEYSISAIYKEESMNVLAIHQCYLQGRIHECFSHTSVLFTRKNP